MAYPRVLEHFNVRESSHKINYSNQQKLGFAFHLKKEIAVTRKQHEKSIIFVNLLPIVSLTVKNCNEVLSYEWPKINLASVNVMQHGSE